MAPKSYVKLDEVCCLKGEICTNPPIPCLLMPQMIGRSVFPRLTAMEAEHCDRVDSLIDFNASNYDTTTTSRTEWWFVNDPTEQRYGHVDLTKDAC